MYSVFSLTFSIMQVVLLMLWSYFQKILPFDCLVIHIIRILCLVPNYSNNIEFD